MNTHRSVFLTKIILVIVTLLLFTNICLGGKSPVGISKDGKLPDKSEAGFSSLSSPVSLENGSDAPENDLCADAIEVQAGIAYNGSTANATGNSTSNCSSSDDLDVWHIFTPTQTSPAVFSLAGSSFDTTLAVYDRCSGTELACNDDTAGTSQSEIIIPVDAGTSYLVRIAGYNHATGDYSLTIDYILSPDNDDCADAIEVYPGIPYFGNTISATGQSTSSCGYLDNEDVWHIFNPTESGIATISLMGSSFNTTLAIYDQCGGTELACNDNAGEAQSEIAMQVEAGKSYLIRIAGYNHQKGDYTLNIYFPPAHDECVNAIEVYSGIPYYASTRGATGESTSGCYDTDRRDVWHVFTPTCSGLLSFSLLDSCFNTTMAIYDGCDGTELACNDNANNSPQSEITMPVQAGATYYIRIAGAQNMTGEYVLSIAPPFVPQNDECIDAIEVQKGMYTGSSHQSTGTMTSSCGMSDDRDVWYVFTPTQSEQITLSLWDSSFDTTLAVYDQCDGTELACSHDANDTYYSILTMPVEAGVSYLIRIAGYNHRTGDYILTISSATSADECSDAIAVQAGIPYHGNTFKSTGNITSNCGSNDFADVWHIYTPTQSDDTTFNLLGSGFDTTLAVYDQCGGTELACNDDAGGTRQSQIIMHVDANTPYLIRVAGYGYQKGYYVLTIDLNSAPKNDDCENAIAITEGIPWHGNTQGATGTDTSGCSGSDDLDVWHVYTPTQSGETTISLVGSSFDTTLAVYDQCDGTELACNDDASGTTQSIIKISLEAGRSYLIRVAGFNHKTGPYILTIPSSNPPVNDECSNAAEITEGLPLYGSTEGATGIDTSGCSNSDDLDTWHIFTPTHTGLFTISVYATFDSIIAVFDQCKGIELACNDDTCDSVGSRITMHMIENTSYLIRVAGYNHTSGEYVIETASNPLLDVIEPNLPSPSNGASNVPTNTVLSWNDTDGQLSHVQDVQSPAMLEAIFGTDDRQEEYQINNPAILAAGDATVILVQLSKLKSNSDGSYTLPDQTLADWYFNDTGNILCPDEPFRDQPAPGLCSGFLVGPDTIVTTGHCVECPCNLRDLAVVFGFVMQDANTPAIVIPAGDVYFVRDIVALQTGFPDWALVRLDRKVEGHTPLPLRQKGKIVDHQSLVAVGYPLGITRKYDLGGSVQDNTAVTYFQADLDIYEGSSGSAVLNWDTMKVEGFAVRGPEDFITDDNAGCDRSNALPSDYGSWQDVTRITALSPVVPSYDIYLGTDPNNVNLVQSGSPLPQFSTESLQPVTTYYWQVVARGASGEKTGPIWEFTTGQ